MRKNRLFLTALIFSLNFALCQAADIRFYMWAQLDAFPGSEAARDAEAGQFEYPIKMMKETAPFLVNGMVYGWDFVYTPSDKARGVEEYFEIIPIQSEEKVIDGIEYENSWVSEDDNRFNCFVRFKRNQNQIQSFNLWSSIQNPTVRGTGKGALEKGFEGIKDAATDAVKDAVRTHYQNEIKNKPKEITGRVIIRKDPVIGISSGNYVINLDFFLESGRIKSYSIF
ncbi:MAG: hypothetical protein MJ185_07335 [Treponema sp.]|nr:hypothetical protein [Treponema sp.]